MAMRFALRPPTSLVGRLFAASAIALLVVVALIGGLVSAGVFWAGDLLSERDVREELHEAQEALIVDEAGGFIRMDFGEGSAAVYDGLPKDVAFRVLDAVTGRQLVGSPPGPALTLLQANVPGADDSLQVLMLDGRKLLTLSRHVSRGGQRYLLQVARSERMLTMLREGDAEMAAGAAAITSLLAVLAFGAIVLWTIRRMLVPVRAASAAATAISPENLSARLDVLRLPAELRPLVKAFNDALFRLELGYQVQQQFLASAAHELKTPLALLRAEVEFSDAANRDQLLADVDYMVRQVNQLLHLTEVSELGNFCFETIDLRPVLLDATKLLSRLAEQHEVDVQLQTPDHPVLQRADASAVFMLVKNLGENAIFHAGDARLVTIVLDEHGLRVRDRGTGFDPGDESRLFERFWRGPKVGRPGAGLGLAICAEVVKAHGWSIQPVRCQPGVEFIVRFSTHG